jgi:hypothetical protein
MRSCRVKHDGDIRIPVVSVIWQYTGLSVPEMEQRVTTYGQYSISTNVTGVKNIKAQTLNGISAQKVYFQVQKGWVTCQQDATRHSRTWSGSSVRTGTVPRYAPFDGVITQRKVDFGSLVEGNATRSRVS